MTHSLRTISTLYEDDDLIILDKPAGLLTIPDRFDSTKGNLYVMLGVRYHEIFIVHRLDRDTSGVIVFAKTRDAHRKLCATFEERTADKRYLGLVNGIPHERNGIIDLAIAEHHSGRGKMAVSHKGKPAVTEYSVIEEFIDFSLVEAKLITGRTHQIRVHMAAIGHPLAVDPLYGTRDKLLLSEIKRSFRKHRDEEEHPLISRTSLHSWKLDIPHPSRDIVLHAEAEIPKDIRAALNQLRKRKR
jgi:23S rRNA pseudouridine1911/1915/1917 synthase